MPQPPHGATARHKRRQGGVRKPCRAPRAYGTRPHAGTLAHPCLRKCTFSTKNIRIQNKSRKFATSHRFRAFSRTPRDTPRLRVGIRPPASGGRGGGTRGGNDAVKRESGGSPEQSRCCKPPFLRIEHECHCAAHGKAFTPDGEVRRPAGVLQVNHGLEEGRALKKRSIGTSKDSLSHAASHPMGAGNPCPAQ